MEPPSPRLKLFPPAFVVSLDEGFSPERDLFGRAPIAKGLTRIIERVDQPLVIALDGDWGSGKTTFLRFWTGELRKAGFPVIFFDAFENDYADDPFIALAGEVFAVAEAQGGRGAAAKAFAAKAADAGKVLLRSSVKVGIKAATMGALSAADMDDLAGAISDEAADAFDTNIGELITKRRKNQKTVADFREALSRLPSRMMPPGEGAEQKPLIFIIDELDRCRPAFALALLERIKHFFSVENVHFVLGINSDQIANSVRAVYGDRIDGRAYLQKFIHLNWTLSQRERYAQDRARYKYVGYLIDSLGFEGETADTAKSSLRFVGAVAEVRDLSFRTIERVMAVVSLALATTHDGHLRVSPLIGGLALMKVLEPSLFVKAKQGRLGFSEVKAFFQFDELKKDEEHSWQWVEKWWQYATDPDVPEEVVEDIRRGLFSYNVGSGRDILAYTADSVMDDVLMRP